MDIKEIKNIKNKTEEEIKDFIVSKLNEFKEITGLDISNTKISACHFPLCMIGKNGTETYVEVKLFPEIW